jgi:hypothetical protein
VECKTAERRPPSAIRYLKTRFPEADAAVISLDQERDVVTADGIRLCSVHRFLMEHA